MAKVLFAITLLGLAIGSAQLQQLPSIDTLSNSLGQRQSGSGSGDGGLGGGLGNLLGGFTGSSTGNNNGQQTPSLIPNLGSLGNMLNGGGQQQQQGLGELLRSIPRRGIEIVQGLMNGVRRMLPGGRQDGQQQQQQQSQSRNPLDLLNLGGNNGASNLFNLPNPFIPEGMENRQPASGLLSSISSGQPLNAISSALSLDKLSGLTDSLTNSQSRNGQAAASAASAASGAQVRN